jgi:hypothetical protein
MTRVKWQFVERAVQADCDAEMNRPAPGVNDRRQNWRERGTDDWPGWRRCDFANKKIQDLKALAAR